MNRLIEAGQLDRLKVTEGDCTLTSQPQSIGARGLTVTIPFRGSQSPLPFDTRADTLALKSENSRRPVPPVRAGAGRGRREGYHSNKGPGNSWAGGHGRVSPFIGWFYSSNNAENSWKSVYEFTALSRRPIRNQG